MINLQKRSFVWILLFFVFYQPFLPAQEKGAASQEQKQLSTPNKPLPKGVSVRLGTTRFRHNRRIHDFVLTSDEKRVVTAGHDGVLHLWNRENGTKIQSFRGDHRPVMAVDLSPDETKLASADRGGNVKIWQVKNGKELRSFSKSSHKITSIAFSSDGKRIFFGEGRRPRANPRKEYIIRVIDHKSGETLNLLGYHSKPVRAIAPVPNRPLLISGSKDGMMYLWNIKTGKLIARKQAYERRLDTIKFHPDRRRFGTLGYRNNSLNSRVKIWRITSSGFSSDSIATNLRRPGDFTFSPDGNILFTVEQTNENAMKISFWKMNSGKVIQEFLVRNSNELNDIDQIQLLSDGVLIFDFGSGLKKVNLNESAQEIHPNPHFSRVISLKFSRDGNRLVSLSRGGDLIQWNDITNENSNRALDQKHAVSSVSYFPDGRILGASRYGDYQFWHEDTGNQLRSKRKEKPYIRFPEQAIHPPGGNNVLISGRQRFKIFSTRPFEPIKASKRFKRIVKAIPSPVWNHVAIQTNEHVLLWNTKTETTVKKVQVAKKKKRRTIIVLSFSSNGNTFSILQGPNGRLKQWDLSSGVKLKDKKWTKPFFRTTALGPQGDVLAIYKPNWNGPNTIQLWNFHTGKKFKTLGEFQTPVTSLSISPDRQKLAAGMANSTILIWDLNPGSWPMEN